MTDSWRVETTPPARRDFKRLDPPVQRRVLAALRELAAEPLSAPLVKLRGSEERRLRVGDWRVRVRLAPEERTVYVLRVLPRGRAYDR